MEGWIALAVIVALAFWAVTIYNGLGALLEATESAEERKAPKVSFK